MNTITTFREFWPYYLGEHSKATTRWMHFAGTSCSIALVIGAIVLQNGWLVLAALVCGYGPAWVSHFGVEKNRPATFKYPFWSLAADFKMWFMMLTGQLSEEKIRQIRAGGLT